MPDVLSGSSPVTFRIAKKMIHLRIRGGYRLLELSRNRGWLNKVVRYRLSDRIAIDVPIFRSDNCFDFQEIAFYESELIHLLCKMISPSAGPVTLIDCGADIGLFSVKLCASARSISKVFALEPNPDAFQWLCRNMKMLPLTAHPIGAAVGDQPGQGTLCSPDYDPSEHGKFIAPNDGGPISIVRIDDLNIIDDGERLLLKLDVEGAELAALRGAAKTIARAGHAVIALEAHPRVAVRTGIDPVEGLRLLKSIRPFEFRVAEVPGLCLNTDQSVFKQIEGNRNSNIVAVSIAD